MFLSVFLCSCLFLSAFFVFPWLWAVLPEINKRWWWRLHCRVLHVYNLTFFGADALGAWTQTPISASLASVPSVPVLRNNHCCRYIDTVHATTDIHVVTWRPRKMQRYHEGQSSRPYSIFLSAAHGDDACFGGVGSSTSAEAESNGCRFIVLVVVVVPFLHRSTVVVTARPPAELSSLTYSIGLILSHRKLQLPKKCDLKNQ